MGPVTSPALTRTVSGRLMLETNLMSGIRNLIAHVDEAAADPRWVKRSGTVLRSLHGADRPVALTETQVLRVERLLREADPGAVPAVVRPRWEAARADALSAVLSWGELPTPGMQNAAGQVPLPGGVLV